MIEVKGKEGIVARVVADSVASTTDIRLTTFEIEYPRWILAEFNTHRMLSRNSMSSRAVPFEKMLEQIQSNPATPVRWGKNQAGMQAKMEDVDDVHQIKSKWFLAADLIAKIAKDIAATGLHKQWVNRLTEPFQRMKTVVSATEWDNFFWLRNHPDSQPEFQELARCMWEARELSKPELLLSGEWHTPYVYHRRNEDGNLVYLDAEGGELKKDDAKKISVSCCAQVSYRKNDGSLQKAEDIFSRFGIGTKTFHASPFEHQATPISNEVGINNTAQSGTWQNGISHMDRDNNFWSGNLKGWIQYRKLVEV